MRILIIVLALSQLTTVYLLIEAYTHETPYIRFNPDLSLSEAEQAWITYEATITLLKIRHDSNVPDSILQASRNAYEYLVNSDELVEIKYDTKNRWVSSRVDYLIDSGTITNFYPGHAMVGSQRPTGKITLHKKQAPQWKIFFKNMESSNDNITVGWTTASAKEIEAYADSLSAGLFKVPFARIKKARMHQNFLTLVYESDLRPADGPYTGGTIVVDEKGNVIEATYNHYPAGVSERHINKASESIMLYPEKQTFNGINKP